VGSIEGGELAVVLERELHLVEAEEELILAARARCRNRCFVPAGATMLSLRDRPSS